VLGVLVAAGVTLLFGCVGNRMFNPTPETTLRTFTTPSGLPYAVGVVEFDDQGEPWDLGQLDLLIGAIERLNRSSEHGIVLCQFIHGWKSNASRDAASGARLAWFEDQVARIAARSEAAGLASGEPGRPVVGLYLGWRGRTYSLPILIDASFWNRRVAAHRVASMRLVEVLARSLHAARTNPDSKSVLIGHSMGGMILEKTFGPVLVTHIMEVEVSGISVPLGYDLIVSANASTEALYTKQLVDVLKRSAVELVLEDEAGGRVPAAGPLLASITSEADVVTGAMVPLAMTVNSLFVRYRTAVDPAQPSQRRLGTHTAGHVPFLHSHTVAVRDGEPVMSAVPGRWNDTPL
jgi:hypothetical protein